MNRSGGGHASGSSQGGAIVGGVDMTGPAGTHSHDNQAAGPFMADSSTATSPGPHIQSHLHTISRFKASAQPQQEVTSSSTPAPSLSPSAATGSMYDLGLATAVQAAVLSGQAPHLAAALEQRVRLMTALSPTALAATSQHRSSSRQSGMRRATWNASPRPVTSRPAPAAAASPGGRAHSPLVTSCLNQLLSPTGSTSPSTTLHAPPPGGGLGCRFPQPPWWGPGQAGGTHSCAKGGLSRRPASALAGGAVEGLTGGRPLLAGELHMTTLLASMPAPLSRTLVGGQGKQGAQVHATHSATTQGSPVHYGTGPVFGHHHVLSVPAAPTPTQPPAATCHPGSSAQPEHAAKTSPGPRAGFSHHPPPASPSARSSRGREGMSPLPHYLTHTPSASPVVLDVVTPEDQDPLILSLPPWVQRSLSRQQQHHQLEQDCHEKESDRSRNHTTSALLPSPPSTSAIPISHLASQPVSPSPDAASHQQPQIHQDMYQECTCSAMDQFDEVRSAGMLSPHLLHLPCMHT
jgi:hypothetical protein